MSGRPTKKTPGRVEKILEVIMSGKTLTDVSMISGMPSLRSIYRWLRDDEEFYKEYAKAIAARTHQMLLEALEIVDRPKSSSTEVAADKLRFEARIKLAGKLNPRHYGDKPEILKSENEAVNKVVVEIVQNGNGGTTDKSE